MLKQHGLGVVPFTPEPGACQQRRKCLRTVSGPRVTAPHRLTSSGARGNLRHLGRRFPFKSRSRRGVGVPAPFPNFPISAPHSPPGGLRLDNLHQSEAAEIPARRRAPPRTGPAHHPAYSVAMGIGGRRGVREAPDVRWGFNMAAAVAAAAAARDS